MALVHIVIIMIFSLLDQYQTKKSFDYAKKLYPKKKDLYKLEKGHLAHFFYKKFGLEKGYYLSFINVIALLIASFAFEIFIGFPMAEQFECIIIGVLGCVNFYHYWNIESYKGELKKKRGRNGKHKNKI